MWSQRPGAHAVAIAALGATFGVLPRALLAAEAVFVTRALHIGPASLGLSFSAWYAISAVSSLFAGRISDRAGARRSLRVASLASCLSLLGMAAAVDWGMLVGFLVLGAVGNALAQPASNLVVAHGVDRRRQGMAFGIKQAAGPSAVLLAGLAVPAVALQVGWRWALLVAAAALLPLQLLASGAPAHAHPTHSGSAAGPLRVSRSLVLLGLAGALAMAASSSLTAFYVASVGSRGIGPGVAGLLLALGSLVSIGARVAYGWLADRRGSVLSLVAALFMLGAGGFLLLEPHAIWMLALGTAVAFAAGWGWPGLLQMTVVLRHPHAPGAASGVLLAATRAGGALGPVLFGLVVAHASYSMAWTASAAVLVLAAGSILVARRRSATVRPG